MICELCGKKLSPSNIRGVCKSTPECRREWSKRWWNGLTEEHRKQLLRNRRMNNYAGVQLARIKSMCKREGIPFDLDSLPEIPASCPCCEKEISIAPDTAWHNKASLDRIFPERGYTAGNVQWLCRPCNRIKDNASPEELMRIALFVKKVSQCVF